MHNHTKNFEISNNPDILSEEIILTALKEKNLSVFPQIYYTPETDSTNLQAKQKAKKAFEDFTIFVADKQTQGRGRQGRSFHSPAGSGIFLSILLKPDIAPDRASMLTLIAGLAVRKAIFVHCSLDAMIKWPNDIVYHQKKLCGILTEMSADADGIHHVVVGIGINVNHSSFPQELSEVATSIFLECKQSFSRAELIASVLEHFQKYYAVFLKTQDFSCLKEEYQNFMINYGKMIVIEEKNQKSFVLLKGITDYGELIIERNGQEEQIVSGEISVRGVYGYV